MTSRRDLALLSLPFDLVPMESTLHPPSSRERRALLSFKKRKLSFEEAGKEALSGVG